MGHTGHFVQFFASESDQTAAVAQYVRDSIESGCTCVVLATPERRSGIALTLRSLGRNIAAWTAGYQYIELDARTVLSGFLEGTRCNRQIFHQTFNTLLRQASSRGEPVRIYGEMVNLLAGDGLTEAALELEELWNELSRLHSFTLFCGYRDATLARSDRAGHARERISAIHSHVMTG